MSSGEHHVVRDSLTTGGKKFHQHTVTLNRSKVGQNYPHFTEYYADNFNKIIWKIVLFILAHPNSGSCGQNTERSFKNQVFTLYVI